MTAGLPIIMHVPGCLVLQFVIVVVTALIPTFVHMKGSLMGVLAGTFLCQMRSFKQFLHEPSCIAVSWPCHRLWTRPPLPHCTSRWR